MVKSVEEIWYKAESVKKVEKRRKGKLRLIRITAGSMESHWDGQDLCRKS